MDTNTFYCGAAREDITPPVGTLLYGYNPHQVSTSVHDPLYVSAVVFRNGNDSVVMLTVTVGDIQNALTQEIREAVSTAVGFPLANVVLSATHTHSAPNVAGFEGWGDIDRPYVDTILLPAAIRAAKAAAASLEPAELAIGEVKSEIGINRRQLTREGNVILGQNPWGAYDPYLTCIAVRSAETKKGIINMLHYGCHGTAAGCNHEISRDWSGIMTDRLEAVTGTLTAFWNGAIGDVGPRLTNGSTVGDIHYVEELGGVAAADAIRAYQARGGYTSAALSVRHGEIRIPYKELPSREEVESRLASYTDPDKLFNIEGLIYGHLKAIKEVYDAGVPAHDDAFRYEQTIISLGDILFIPHPFEVFSEICLRLRAYAPARYVLNLSNSNGYNAYMPTEDQIVRGGYEVGVFLHAGAYTLVNNADQIIINENLRIIKNNEP
ncbi:MAG: neutral/alkaline non-lysosomal ceramidase N-terminal domain-containing protein [Eubacteriales bacterium]